MVLITFYGAYPEARHEEKDERIKVLGKGLGSIYWGLWRPLLFSERGFRYLFLCRFRSVGKQPADKKGSLLPHNLAEPFFGHSRLWFIDFEIGYLGARSKSPAYQGKENKKIKKDMDGKPNPEWKLERR